MKPRDNDVAGLRISAEQEEAVERFAKLVVRFGMTTPTILFLETVKPMNRIGATTLVFFQPVLSPLMSFSSLGVLAELLEDRRAIEYLIRRVEAVDRGEPSPALAGEQGAPEEVRGG